MAEESAEDFGSTKKRAGVAKIKREYMLYGGGDEKDDTPPVKRPKMARGQNKNRYGRSKKDDTLNNLICRILIDVPEGVDFPQCKYPNCRDSHDVKTYLKTKLPDIATECHVFNTFGHCPRGFTCRYASQHITEEGKNKRNEEKMKLYESQSNVLNPLKGNFLQMKLRKRQYDFTKANNVLKTIMGVDKVREDKNTRETGKGNSKQNSKPAVAEEKIIIEEGNSGPAVAEDKIAINEENGGSVGAEDKIITDERNSEPAVAENKITINEENGRPVGAEDKITINEGNGGPAVAEDKGSSGPAVAEDKIITEEGNSGPAVAEDKIIIEEGSSGPAVAEDKIIIEEENIEPAEKKININEKNGGPTVAEDKIKEDDVTAIGPVCDDGIAREKKKIDWRGKLYLSPLTTLGNLPFRRICKETGADITCGEMAMATSILQGLPSEWALLRRHSSEDLFGVQVCGNNPYALSRCAQLINETVDVDFIDLNLGCPIELVYKHGGGCGLLTREKNLTSVVQAMSQTMSVPLTVKTRTGVYEDKLVALKYMPLFTASGVSALTVHGRTREQRYTKTADWDYINSCAAAAAPIPVFGNGDILNRTDYNHVVATYTNVSGVMIGRGALYKPWIFTEIKEQRDWDISSKERLDILKKFVNYGFEHWGSDTKGVENTRRFLLEWLSFLYRYIPLGVLEVPQRINERAPRYVGRDDLETLMSSPNCSDWVKISEMLCGPVPEGFTFLPKHKANAWTN